LRVAISAATTTSDGPDPSQPDRDRRGPNTELRPAD
jgi:hypothetical protein